MARTDRVLRQFCQSAPHRVVGLLRHVLRIPMGPIAPFSAMDARLEPPALEADFLAFEGRDHLLHLELQGYADRGFPERVFAYSLNAALRFRDREVRSIAIWLRTPSAEQRAPRVRRGAIEVSIDHVVIPELDAKSLIAAGFAFLAPCADAGALSIDELCDVVARELVRSNASVDEIAVAMVAAACRWRYHPMRAAMARAGISEPVILEDFVEIGFDMGVEKGREQGLEKGREQGLETGLRAAVLAVAEVLGLAIDDRRRAEIERMDERQLGALLERLKRLRSFE